jgi:hypothetical protein
MRNGNKSLRKCHECHRGGLRDAAWWTVPLQLPVTHAIQNVHDCPHHLASPDRPAPVRRSGASVASIAAM